LGDGFQKPEWKSKKDMKDMKNGNYN